MRPYERRVTRLAILRPAGLLGSREHYCFISYRQHRTQTFCEWFVKRRRREILRRLLALNLEIAAREARADHSKSVRPRRTENVGWPCVLLLGTDFHKCVLE